ncbi:MAG TPA: CPBP family intramembrane glutamic endopeptidase, partial [Gemmata sp.]
LCVLLLLNLAFFTLLRELFKPFGAVEPERMKMTLLTVLLVCVQPAIVEELFFRQMALGVLRKSVNVHLAIWLTAGVFAGAHLGNILGMPYLFLVGGFLGYARTYGGLTLAMILHFLHNFAVVAYDAWRP